MYFKQNRDVGMCYCAHSSCYFVVVFRNMWTSQDGNYKYDLLEYVDTLDSTKYQMFEISSVLL